MIKNNKKRHPSDLSAPPWCEAPSEAPAWCGAHPVQVIQRSNGLPASQPRRPVAASATPSRLLKGDTIPINVFLSTLLRCLFNTAPGGFGARTAWVKLHFSGLKERCDKSPVRVRDSQGPSGSDGSHGGRHKLSQAFVFVFKETKTSLEQSRAGTFQAQTPVSYWRDWSRRRINRAGGFQGTSVERAIWGAVTLPAQSGNFCRSRCGKSWFGWTLGRSSNVIHLPGKSYTLIVEVSLGTLITSSMLHFMCLFSWAVVAVVGWEHPVWRYGWNTLRSISQSGGETVIYCCLKWKLCSFELGCIQPQKSCLSHD